MAIKTRDLSITYGDLKVGGDSGREIMDVVFNERRFDQFILECEFLISKSAGADFTSEIASVEAAFRTPFQNLTVLQGGQTLYAFSQSSNTGMDARPEITKRVDQGASGKSRIYGVRIVLDLPANTGAELQTGLREHSVQVAYEANRRRTVTVSGTVTAAGGNNARAQYEAIIGALETSVFSALGIGAANRELVEEPEADHSYNTKSLTFQRLWRELVYSQGGSSLDDADIKNQVLQVGRSLPSPGDTPSTAGILRLTELPVTYSATLDKDRTTDLRGKWDSIRGWLIQQVTDTLGGGPLAIVEETPDFDYENNSFSVQLLVRGKGGQVLSRTLRVEDQLRTGWVLVPVWDGDPMTKYAFQGPAKRVRIVSDTKTIKGFFHQNPVELFKAGQDTVQGSLDGMKNPGGLSFKHLDTSFSVEPLRLGQGSDQTIDVTNVTKTDIFEFYKEPKRKPPTLATVKSRRR